MYRLSKYKNRMATPIETIQNHKQELEFADSGAIKSELEHRFGLSGSEIDIIEQQAEAMLPETRVVVRTPLSALDGIISKGRLQAAGETETSNGLTAGTDRNHERIDEYITLRRQFESDKLQWSDEDPPIIYGFLGYSDNPEDSNIQAPMYGRVELKLNADVSERSSYTVGDSLIKVFDNKPPQLLDHTDATLVQQAIEYSRQIDKHALNQVPYVEAQVRGGVSIDDIESVAITIEPNDLDEQMLNLLSELSVQAPGCKIVVNLDYSSPQKLPIDTIRALPAVEFRPVIISSSEPSFIQLNKDGYPNNGGDYEEYRYNETRERYRSLGKKFLDFFSQNEKPSNLGEPSLGHYLNGDRFPPEK